jgi:hypothetical protein
MVCVVMALLGAVIENAFSSIVSGVWHFPVVNH